MDNLYRIHNFLNLIKLCKLSRIGNLYRIHNLLNLIKLCKLPIRDDLHNLIKLCESSRIDNLWRIYNLLIKFNYVNLLNLIKFVEYIIF